MGISVRSPPSSDASDFPSGLARPQSTTSVSPCLPTITLAGLMSRWSTPAAVGVLDGVADVDEPPQQVAELERAAAGVAPERLVGVESLDRLLEAVAPDEPHRVVRPAAVVGPQAVDRDDAGMLEPAGDLGLDAGTGVRLAGSSAWRSRICLSADLAVELGVEGDEDGAQAAPGVGPEDAEPLAVGGGAGSVAGGPVGVAARSGRAGADAGERGLDRRDRRRRRGSRGWSG